MIHPNLVRRPQRVRESMKGKYARYFPVGVTKNFTLEIGELLRIKEFEHKGGKGGTLVAVEKTDGTVTSVMFSDLAFVH